MGTILNFIQQAKRRRREVARRIGDGAVVFSAAKKTAPERPDNYLYYLSGCAEPQSALILIAKNGGLQKEILFVRGRCPAAERWDGRRLGLSRARRQLQIDATADIENFADELQKITASCESFYYLPGEDDETDKLVRDICKHRRRQNRAGQKPLAVIRDISAVVDDMRLIKDECELDILRQAVNITETAHLAAMRRAPFAKYEYELDAELTKVYREHNARHAFPPIVAGGGNGNILHYGDNDAAIVRNQLLLVDSGCEWRGYAADITRTYPAGKKFSAPQAEVYDIVLRAQQKAVAAIRPGVRWQKIETIVVQTLAAGLCSLGICKGDAKTIIAEKKYKDFYMHRAGHFLGLDVHDVGCSVGDDGKSRRLQKGMVVTVEPGLYLAATKNIPKPYRNIAVRIEDDVLVTENGNEVLSRRLPKTRAAIEKWMNG